MSLWITKDGKLVSGNPPPGAERVGELALTPKEPDMQPIDSAPRNGRMIIAWNKEEGFDLIRRVPNTACVRSFWFSCCEFDHLHTHWSPLPKPPEDGS